MSSTQITYAAQLRGNNRRVHLKMQVSSFKLLQGFTDSRLRGYETPGQLGYMAHRTTQTFFCTPPRYPYFFLLLLTYTPCHTIFSSYINQPVHLITTQLNHTVLTFLMVSFVRLHLNIHNIWCIHTFSHYFRLGLLDTFEVTQKLPLHVLVTCSDLKDKLNNASPTSGLAIQAMSIFNSILYHLHPKYDSYAQTRHSKKSVFHIHAWSCMTCKVYFE